MWFEQVFPVVCVPSAVKTTSPPPKNIASASGKRYRIGESSSTDLRGTYKPRLFKFLVENSNMLLISYNVGNKNDGPSPALETLTKVHLWLQCVSVQDCCRGRPSPVQNWQERVGVPDRPSL